MKKRILSLSSIIVVIVLFLSACQPPNTKENGMLQIALSRSADSYQQWLLQSDSNINFIDLYGLPVEKAVEVLQNCDGVVITGGEDIHPSRYQQPEDTVLCNGFNLYRDTLDAAIVMRAVEYEIPVFAICRGLQMTNVALGGSLVVDIPSQWNGAVAHRKPEYADVLHPVTLNQASLLQIIAGQRQVDVISNHHQGIDRVAEDLRVVARAADGLPEAIEWKDPVNRSFLLGVQFHPERYANSEFSMALAEFFLKEVRKEHAKSEQMVEE